MPKITTLHTVPLHLDDNDYDVVKRAMELRKSMGWPAPEESNYHAAPGSVLADICRMYLLAYETRNDVLPCCGVEDCSCSMEETIGIAVHPDCDWMAGSST
jgi:hypothetical protein